MTALRARVALVAAAVVMGPGLVADQSATSSTVALVAATRSFVRGHYENEADAVRAGYLPETTDTPVVHYIDIANVTHGGVLDPRRPAALMYTNDAAHPRLLGAMFLMDAVGVSGPRIPGAPHAWHHHELCVGALGAFTPGFGEHCPSGDTAYHTPEMAHVWLADASSDPFAPDMTPKECVIRASGDR
jgi:hypothetical protein